MANQEVVAKLSDGDRVVKQNYDFGNDLNDMVNKFGEEVVFNNCRKSLVIDLQALIRRKMKPAKEGEAPATDEQITADVKAWVPGVSTTVRKSASEKAKDAIDKLSPEEKKSLLAALKKG